METIFKAAQTKEFSTLPSLLPPKGKGTCDGDCKALCNPGNKEMIEELGHNYTTTEAFVSMFSKAKIIETPEIKGNTAKVHFLFGPNNRRKETMHLQNIEGKWYLDNF